MSRTSPVARVEVSREVVVDSVGVECERAAPPDQYLAVDMAIDGVLGVTEVGRVTLAHEGLRLRRGRRHRQVPAFEEEPQKVAVFVVEAAE